MSTPPHHRPKPATIVLVPLVAALVLTLFAWPSARLRPRDLPIGVAGPPAAAHALERKLAARDGAFDVHRYASKSAARAAIEDRDVYGAFVATPGGARVLTSTAASAAVAQMITHVASEGDRPAQVQDVVRATRAGGGLPSSVLPLVLAGALTGILSALMAAGPLRRAVLVVAGSVLAGLAATAIVQSWLGVVGGAWLANAAALTLTIMAIAAFVAGLYSLLGQAGAILGLLTMVLIANPFSGVGSAPELLPRPVGDIGQLMPPGAGGNLLRSTGYFDGAAAGGHVAVLVVWALAGFFVVVLAGARARIALRHRPPERLSGARGARAFRRVRAGSAPRVDGGRSRRGGRRGGWHGCGPGDRPCEPRCRLRWRRARSGEADSSSTGRSGRAASPSSEPC